MVDTFQGKVLNTSLGFVPSRHDAEDIVQEVFLEVFRSINNFQRRLQIVYMDLSNHNNKVPRTHSSERSEKSENHFFNHSSECMKTQIE